MIGLLLRNLYWRARELWARRPVERVSTSWLMERTRTNADLD